MSNARAVLTAFMGLSYKDYVWNVFFELKNGTPVQGWLNGVEESEVLFHIAGPMADPDPCAEERIPIDDIDLESLAYYDLNKKEWLPFRFDEWCSDAM